MIKNLVIKKTLGVSESGELAKLASEFVSDVFLSYKGRTVNLKSIMGVMSLGIAENVEISLEVSGKDEVEAMDSLEDFLLNK